MTVEKHHNFCTNWDVATGKKPDILLFDDSRSTLMVIESKEASKKNVLDGRYHLDTNAYINADQYTNSYIYTADRSYRRHNH
jgi:hypothetical protein